MGYNVYWAYPAHQITTNYLIINHITNDVINYVSYCAKFFFLFFLGEDLISNYDLCYFYFCDFQIRENTCWASSKWKEKYCNWN